MDLQTIKFLYIHPKYTPGACESVDLKRRTPTYTGIVGDTTAGASDCITLSFP